MEEGVALHPVLGDGGHPHTAARGAVPRDGARHHLLHPLDALLLAHLLLRHAEGTVSGVDLLFQPN